MAEFYAEKRVVILPDPETLADSVAARFLDRVAKRAARGKKVHISLTGGVIGTAVLAAAAERPEIAGIDWTLVHFWWGDERFVPRDSDDRNERTARTALLNRVGVPEANIHAIAASDDGVDMETGADAYAQELALFAHGGDPWPTFDICFLGVGPDAHIASLFPDRAEIQVTDRTAVVVRDSPKPPSERITLTRPVLNSSKRVWMVMAGTDKAAALGLALAGASYESVPAAGAKGTRRTVFFVDEAAAAQVPANLIDGEY